jgi:hypothetical protein
VDFAMRVDIMCLKSGQMVVNEFESLEANYVGYGNDEIDTEAFYTAFWATTLTQCIQKIRAGRR